jgi:hypothetical protein
MVQNFKFLGPKFKILGVTFLSIRDVIFLIDWRSKIYRIQKPKIGETRFSTHFSEKSKNVKKKFSDFLPDFWGVVYRI